MKKIKVLLDIKTKHIFFKRNSFQIFIMKIYMNHSSFNLKHNKTSQSYETHSTNSFMQFLYKLDKSNYRKNKDNLQQRDEFVTFPYHSFQNFKNIVINFSLNEEIWRFILDSVSEWNVLHDQWDFYFFLEDLMQSQNTPVDCEKKTLKRLLDKKF